MTTPSERKCVYADSSNWYFSEGVSRDFGENKIITFLDGDAFISSVQPLRCEPMTSGLRLVGTIAATKPRATTP